MSHSEHLEQLREALADHYRVERELGRGGMATVYFAEDLRHKRPVAIKVLRPEVTSTIGSERFLREIEIAGGLRHPHILPVYDSGSAGHVLYYVMPFVEGESLRGRLKREGQLPVDDAVDIGREVADALSYAHSHDVVHRDIKPENILLESGHAVVADFGIARAISGASSDSLTETGVSIGTPAYMSPEQLTSSDVDGRSDIYSLGCVLYEMLSGEAPLTGATAQAMVARRLSEVPLSLITVRDTVPPWLEDVVLTALARVPADRFATAQELVEALKHGATGSSRPSIAGARVRATRAPTPLPEQDTPATPIPVTTTGDVVSEARLVPRSRGMQLLVTGVGIVAVVLGVGLVIRQAQSVGDIPVPEARQISFAGNVQEASLSPDGRFIAYLTGPGSSAEQLFVQEIGVGSAVELYSTDEFFCCVQWSSDATNLLFRTGPRTGGSTLVLPRTGGMTPRRVITDVISAWSPDGSRIVSWWPQARALVLTDVSTGDSVGSIPLESDYDWVQAVDWSPTSDAVVVGLRREPSAFTLWVVGVDGRDSKMLLRDSTALHSPRWSGNAIYYVSMPGQSREIWKLPVDRDGTPRGSPVRVVPRLEMLIRNSAIPSFHISSDGTRFLYTRHLGYANIWTFGAVSGDGREPVTNQLTTGTAFRSTPRVSPDGSEMVFVEFGASGSNLFIMPVDGGPARQLTFMEGTTWTPAWSPDGQRIAFGADQGEGGRVWMIDVDGGAPRAFPETSFASDNDLVWAPASHIIYQRTDHRNFYLLDPETGEQELLWADSVGGWFYEPVPSPDGSVIAFRRTGGDSLGLSLVTMTERIPRVIGPRGSGPFAWSNDGSIVYGMLIDGRTDAANEVYSFRASDGAIDEYATLPFRVGSRNIAMLESGREYVAAVAATQSDVWLIENFDPARARR